jgi:hypothetical protein
MRRNPRIRAKRTRRSGKVVVPLLMAILIGGVGAFVTLTALGQINVDFGPIASLFGQAPADDQQADQPASRATEPPDGWTAVLITTREIPPFTQITREFFRDPTSGDPTDLMYTIYPEEKLSEVRSSQSIGTIAGRVTRMTIAPLTVVTESALFPPGTRPGPAAGVPAEFSMLTIEANELRGIDSLLIYDRFDILATFPARASASRPATAGRGIETLVSRDALSDVEAAPEPEVVLVAQGAMVIEPVFKDEGSSRSKERFSFAASPDELASLQEALAHGATLRAVARSNHPDADRKGPLNLAMKKPADEPDPDGIEAIVGPDKKVIVVPSGKR